MDMWNSRLTKRSYERSRPRNLMKVHVMEEKAGALKPRTMADSEGISWSWGIVVWINGIMNEVCHGVSWIYMWLMFGLPSLFLWTPLGFLPVVKYIYTHILYTLQPAGPLLQWEGSWCETAILYHDMPSISIIRSNNISTLTTEGTAFRFTPWNPLRFAAVIAIPKSRHLPLDRRSARTLSSDLMYSGWARAPIASATWCRARSSPRSLKSRCLPCRIEWTTAILSISSVYRGGTNKKNSKKLLRI